MNGPEGLLHMVTCEEICGTSKLMEEAVLRAEHGCRSDDRSFRVDIASHFFAKALFVHHSAVSRSVTGYES